LLRVVLFLQVLTLSLLIGAGIYLYNYVQVINSEIETVMSVIQDIQALLPKLNATADAVSSLQSQFGEAFKTLSDLSLFFNNFLELFSQYKEIPRYENQILHN